MRRLMRWKVLGFALLALALVVVAGLAGGGWYYSGVLEDGALVREKRHKMTRLSVQEAAAQMDLLGHGFYLFTNIESGEANVVYKRHDGDYGLIIPEE